MKKQLKMILMGAAAAALAGCTVSIDEGGGTTIGGGGGNDGPAPVQRVQLPGTLKTSDNDGIRVFGQARGGQASDSVTVCLKTRQGMWKKEVNFGSVTLRSENGGTDCANTRANGKRLYFRKAKFAGVITDVGSDSLDLTGWAGGIVTIVWNSD